MSREAETSFKLRIAAGAASVALVAAGFLAYCYQRGFDVGATTRHPAFIERIARATLERSIRARARDVAVPEGVDLRDRALAERAIGHYVAACRTCHGAPGAPRDPWIVLYPDAPDLTRSSVVERWTDRELYWIVKHGIKDTGMIALGPTHQERDLWAVAAFVRQLPTLTPERYRELAAHAGHRH